MSSAMWPVLGAYLTLMVFLSLPEAMFDTRSAVHIQITSFRAAHPPFIARALVPLPHELWIVCEVTYAVLRVVIIQRMLV